MTDVDQTLADQINKVIEDWYSNMQVVEPQKAAVLWYEAGTRDAHSEASAWLYGCAAGAASGRDQAVLWNVAQKFRETYISRGRP